MCRPNNEILMHCIFTLCLAANTNAALIQDDMLCGLRFTCPQKRHCNNLTGNALGAELDEIRRSITVTFGHLRIHPAMHLLVLGSMQYWYRCCINIASPLQLDSNVAL